jgi:hypothetical protein
MDDGTMDGWKKLHEKRPQPPLLYVIVLLVGAGRRKFEVRHLLLFN